MNTESSVLVSASGEDRPGIVAAVTRILFETGCNLEDSAMTRLEGAFAMLVVARVANEKMEGMRRAFEALGAETGLAIHVKVMSEAEARTPAPGGEPYIISLYGADKPGLVYRVADMLDKMHVNITDVVTHRSSTTRRPLYQLVFEVELPSIVDSADLRHRLDLLASELEVEINSHPMELVEL